MIAEYATYRYLRCVVNVMKYFDKYLADFDKIYIYLQVFRVKELNFGIIFMIGRTRKH